MTICTLYKAMVRPHLEGAPYRITVFYQKDILKVESIQRRATKLISELRDKTYGVRLKELELPSLVYRRRRGDMVMMFKVMYGLVRMDSSILFTSALLGRTRGHNKKVYKSHAVKTARSNSFSPKSGQQLERTPKLRRECTFTQFLQKTIRRTLARHPQHHQGIEKEI